MQWTLRKFGLTAVETQETMPIAILTNNNLGPPLGLNAADTAEIWPYGCWNTGNNALKV
jgi:hypothetical protein